MIDAIVYNPDPDWLITVANKTPVHSSNGNSIVLVRVDDLNIIQGEALTAVSQGEDPFALLSGVSLEKYNMAYPRPIITIPSYTIEGETFPESTYQDPEKFGGFA